MTASGNPPPLPQQTLAQLQLASHLQTLKVLFFALAGFHWFATVAFLGLSAWVAHSRGLDDAWMLTTIYASIAALAAVLIAAASATAVWSGRRAMSNNVVSAVREDW